MIPQGRSKEIGNLEQEVGAELFVYKGHPFFDRDSVSFQKLEIAAKTMEHRVIMKFVRKKMGIGIDVSFTDADRNLENIRAVPIQEKPKWEVYLI